jgi:hypothetical protein
VKKTLLLIAVFLGILAAISYVKTRLMKPARDNQGEFCDMSLWEHVYHGRFASAQDRLPVINPCVTVSGMVVSARRETDGDWHIQLELDPEFSSLLNEVNLERQQGYLVLEPMCSNRVSQIDTIEEGVCDTFHQTIFTPDLIGHRVAATGAHVIDREHGWTELHPVTSIVPVQ